MIAGFSAERDPWLSLELLMLASHQHEAATALPDWILNSERSQMVRVKCHMIRALRDDSRRGAPLAFEQSGMAARRHIGISTCRLTSNNGGVRERAQRRHQATSA